MVKIKVRGKEYDLALTVGAFAEISDICPGGEFSRIGELMNQSESKAIIATVKMIVAMSKGAEDQKHYENLEYQPDPLTFEALRSLPVAEYIQIHRSCGRILNGEMEARTVETKASKKKEADESQ